MSVAEELTELFVHTVMLTPLIGSGAYGDAHGEPIPNIACLVDETSQLVRDRAGTEVVSSAVVYAPVDAPACSPGSLIALPSGREAVVISEARRTLPGMDMPEHTEWRLT